MTENINLAWHSLFHLDFSLPSHSPCFKAAVGLWVFLSCIYVLVHLLAALELVSLALFGSITKFLYYSDQTHKVIVQQQAQLESYSTLVFSFFLHYSSPFMKLETSLFPMDVI